MKRHIILLLLLLLVLPVPTGQAQDQVTTIDSLSVDFWPDYDQPSVLVLMRGTLPAETAVPATLTIPLPEGARVNAVAYVDAANSTMNTEYTLGNNAITLTTPALNFRVEYYLPYVAEEGQRSFTFNWDANVAVNQFQAQIQQPISASGLITEPAAANVTEGSDGFVYHILPPQAITTGQPLTLHVNYIMSSPQLSVEGLNNATIDLQPSGPVSTPPSEPASEFNWPLIAGVAGGILMIAALVFLYVGNRPKSRIYKPRPVRQPTKNAARFCHNCGGSLEAGDRFCRKCGTPVKGK